MFKEDDKSMRVSKNEIAVPHLTVLLTWQNINSKRRWKRIQNVQKGKDIRKKRNQNFKLQNLRGNQLIST
jgi:hypothetical protein